MGQKKYYVYDCNWCGKQVVVTEELIVGPNCCESEMGFLGVRYG